MKSNELDAVIKKLGGSKKGKFVFHKFLTKGDLNYLTHKEAKKDFIDEINKMGYVPIKIKCKKSNQSSNWVCGAPCAYFGKKKAPYIKEIIN